MQSETQSDRSTMKQFIRLNCILFGFFSICLVSPLSAQTNYPDHEIKIIVPFPAGGAADSVARFIARELTSDLGQPVIVDNKPGADGGIAAEYVAHAKPDGYTLFMATYGAMSVVPIMHPMIHYNPVADFTPITLTGFFDLVLFVHPSLELNSYKDFVSYAKQHKGEILYGSGNTGSVVAMAILASREGLEMKHIPYKGEVPAMTDFLEGRIQAMIATPANTAHWVQEGKLKALVSLSPDRSALLPNVPTLEEEGYAPIPLSTWGGIFGPHDMQADQINFLSHKINQILLRPNIQHELGGQGFHIQGSTPDALADLTGHQLIVWRKAVSQAGLPVQ
jgi:tripartite-type tricarboxylate transporter receptor subunit TctC